MLHELKLSAEAAGNVPWWRTHSQIIRAGPKGTGEVVALAESYETLYKKGCIGYDIDPRMEGPNSRHIVTTSPSRTQLLINVLTKLYPELKYEQHNEPARKDKIKA
jgi:hypothetical protein